jgi:hypothetical protein
MSKRAVLSSKITKLIFEYNDGPLTKDRAEAYWRIATTFLGDPAVLQWEMSFNPAISNTVLWDSAVMHYSGYDRTVLVLCHWEQGTWPGKSPLLYLSYIEIRAWHVLCGVKYHPSRYVCTQHMTDVTPKNFTVYLLHEVRQFYCRIINKQSRMVVSLSANCKMSLLMLL